VPRRLVEPVPGDGHALARVRLDLAPERSDLAPGAEVGMTALSHPAPAPALDPVSRPADAAAGVTDLAVHPRAHGAGLRSERRRSRTRPTVRTSATSAPASATPKARRTGSLAPSYTYGPTAT